MKRKVKFLVFVGLLPLASTASAKYVLEANHAVEQLINILTMPVERAQRVEMEQQRQPNAVAANARLIEVGTADIVVAAAEAELAKTPLVAQELEKVVTMSEASVKYEDSELDKTRSQLLGRLKSLGYNTKDIVKKNLSLSQIQIDYNIFIRRVATKNELPEFLEEISNLGKKNSLIFELFQPLPTKIGYFYQLKPLKIIVRAQPSQLEQFISSLPTLPRLISLYKQVNFLCQQPNIIQAELVLVFPYFEDDKLSINESGYHFSKLDGIPDLPNQKFTCISNPTP